MGRISIAGRSRAAGASLYWEGLNKGKKSIAIDLSRLGGPRLAQSDRHGSRRAGGLFVTNYPPEGFLSHARLAALRPDLITLRVMGWADGGTAVDYTVNAALGIPDMTGPPTGGPVNHRPPGWDLMAGAYGAMALLAAERLRRDTGQGQEIRLPLAQLALASLGTVGQIAEVVTTGADRPRYGNDLFGAFGRDFVTRDGERLMIVAITRKQWTGLVEALSLAAEIAALEGELGVSFADDEGARFIHRERLFPLVEGAIAGKTAGELADAPGRAARFAGARIAGMQRSDGPGDRFARLQPLAPEVTHPSGATYPTPGAAADFAALERGAPLPAPRLGSIPTRFSPAF